VPPGACGRPELEPADDEDLSYLCGEWRVFQKVSGHRWSLDDLVTAAVAGPYVATTGATRALDLGCGLGSVLLMVAWQAPALDCTGLEAQADRAELARRSIAYNGVTERCRVVTGDLREGRAFPEGTRFGLVTGTPPYFPSGTGTESDKTHAAPCRFEHRGGVEGYLEAAVRWLAPGGRVVICTASLERQRVTDGARAAGLEIESSLEVIPREGKAALIDIDVLCREATATRRERLVVRDATHQWTEDFKRLRARVGMPTSPPRGARHVSQNGQ
jgi:tRNA1(Val) A37 N6-methylase TrmN6